jgi:hypothetical protein
LGIHSVLAIPAAMILLTRLSFTNDFFFFQDAFNSSLFIWLYMLYLPHLLGFYLYHIRWNPKTVARKQKLDEEEFHYEGDFRLKDGVQYRLGEDGELIEVEDNEETLEENS